MKIDKFRNVEATIFLSIAFTVEICFEIVVFQVACSAISCAWRDLIIRITFCRIGVAAVAVWCTCIVESRGIWDDSSIGKFAERTDFASYIGRIRNNLNVRGRADSLIEAKITEHEHTVVVAVGHIYEAAGLSVPVKGW